MKKLEESNKLIYGDSLDVMSGIETGSVDMILADLPYGLTRNKWDSVIDIPSLWAEYGRIIKGNGAIVLTASQPFTSSLVMSNLPMFRYSLVWQKTNPVGHLNAKRRPLRSHEDILVFSKGQTVYNPQKTSGHKRKVATAHHRRNSKRTTNYGEFGLHTYDSTERYPTSVLTFKSDKQKTALHPTQKPVALFEYLIKTYSNEGDIIMDNTCGSGTTGVSCVNTGRRFILIDNDIESVKISSKRLSIDYYTPASLAQKREG